MTIPRRLSLTVFVCSAFVLRAQTTVLTVGRVIAPQTLAPSGATAAINLADYFTVPGVSGQVVQFDTVLGKFDVALRPDVAPKNVANFLGYVQRGDYTNTFFHRSASFDGSSIAIVQGGGYVATSSGIANVPAQAPVPLEYNLPNVRGSLAAARATDPNSATSQWYFNVQDNSTALGPSSGGYTVFGQVLGSGMTVIDAIAALPRVNAGQNFEELPVHDYSSGNVQNSNLVIVNSITTVSLMPDSGGGASFINFSVQSSNSAVVSAALSGSVLTLTPGAAGTATVSIHAVDVNGNTVDTSFTVTVTSSPPTITAQPNSYTIATGDTFVLSGAASAASSYQWQHNGADVFGATDTTLVVRNASSADAGTYTLIARNANGSVTSSAATVTVSAVAPADVSRLVNLSVRSNAGSGAQTLIVGFAVGGAGTVGTTPLLIRGMGPSLALLGVSGFLPDPVATLYSGTTVVASNDNWGGDGTISARANQVGAFGFESADSLDAALAIAPAAGSYTVQITANGGTTGNALAEIYDATASGSITTTSPRLTNVSGRTQVGTGDNILIAGFVIRGSTAKTVLIRAVGPGLTQFGVSGVLADPVLRLVPGGTSTAIAANDNWSGDPQIATAAASVGAFPLVNGGSTDAALLVTLNPGNYTAQVTGANGSTGVALVEVYEVQ